MSDRERTMAAAITAGASVVVAALGFLVSGNIAVVGFALMALGGLGAIQAVLIGLGLIKVGPIERESRPLRRRRK
jgi:hypothetical protein